MLIRVAPSAVLAMVAAVLVAGGCGGGDESTTTSTTVAATDRGPVHPRLTHCPASAGGRLAAGGWSGSVAGIGCGRAGRLILNHFIRDCVCRGRSTYESIRTANPAPFRSAGFKCGSFPLEDGSGWHVVCDRDDEQVSYFATP
jgi:hypothetical protein